MPSAEDREEGASQRELGFELGLKNGQIGIQETAPVIKGLACWNVELRDD